MKAANGAGWNVIMHQTTKGRNPFYSAVYGDLEEIEQPKRRVKDEIVSCRVLVLESSVKDNHAHIMMMLRPGAIETQEQIEAVAGIVRPKADARISIDWANEQIDYTAISSI